MNLSFSLEIRENAIDRLVRLYKDAVYKTGVSIISLLINLIAPDNKTPKELFISLSNILFQISGLFDKKWVSKSKSGTTDHAGAWKNGGSNFQRQTRQRAII